MDSQLDPFVAADVERKAEQHEYFLRGKIAVVCEAVLAEEVGIIVASRKLSGLGFQLLDRRDDDFERFDGIASETDHLPVDIERQNWSIEALARKDKEIAEVESFYREEVKAACRKLLDRFALPHSTEPL